MCSTRHSCFKIIIKRPISCVTCWSAPAPGVQQHLRTIYIGLMLQLRVKPKDSYGRTRSCFCNPNFGTFFNLSSLLYEYTEIISGFHHTFWASVIADKWIRESDAHIRCHGNNPSEGQYVLLWAYGTQNFLIFFTFICYNNNAAVVYTLNTVSV